jgi:signal transduction histidine kinase
MAAQARVIRSRSSTSPPRFETLAQGRLQTYIRADLLAILIAIAWLIAVRIGVVADWFDVLVLLQAVLVGCMLRAGRLVSAGRAAAAGVLVAAANWSAVILDTAIAPFGLLIMPPFVLAPVLLAVPHMNRENLSALLGGAVAATLTLATVGRLSSGVGLENLVPDGVWDALTVTFIPVSVGLACILAWQSHQALAARADALHDTGARLAAATDRERSRIERDLHDGAQQRLVVVAMQLRVAQRLQHTDPDQAADLLGTLAQDVQYASAELRDLSHGIYPAQLNDQGLAAALHAEVLRIPLPVTVHCEHLGRHPPQIESAVYFSCLEGLQNIVKH